MIASSETLCSACGCRLPAGAPEGLCPGCLLTAALAEPDEIAEVAPVAASSGPERSFGDYELLRKIDVGATGVVYEARQKSLGRIVALKLLIAGAWATEETLRRFRAEARAAAAARHPRIVAIHEIGEVDGQPYIAMDLISGRSLAERLREGPFDPHEAARIVASLAETVHCAHEQGIIHRDLKPSNVLLDREGEPHVTDFGLAKNLENPGLSTQTGTMLGTPGYMPPEQVRSGTRRGVAAPRAAPDVYSLGAILYALLTGHPPFLEDLIQLLETEPDPPGKLRPGLSPDLEAITLRCLEKMPEQRYPSAWDLAEDLRRFLAGRPVSARPVGWPGRLTRRARRTPALPTALVLALALTLAWAATRDPGPGSTDPPEPIALDPAAGRASPEPMSAPEILSSPPAESASAKEERSDIALRPSPAPPPPGPPSTQAEGSDDLAATTDEVSIERPPNPQPEPATTAPDIVQEAESPGDSPAQPGARESPPSTATTNEQAPPTPQRNLWFINGQLVGETPSQPVPGQGVQSPMYLAPSRVVTTTQVIGIPMNPWSTTKAAARIKPVLTHLVGSSDAFSFSDDGQLLAAVRAATDTVTMEVLSLPDGELLERLEGGKYYDRDYPALLLPGSDRPLAVWNASKGQIERLAWDNPQSLPRFWSLAPSGRHLAAVDASGSICIWSTGSGALIHLDSKADGLRLLSDQQLLFYRRGITYSMDLEQQLIGPSPFPRGRPLAISRDGRTAIFPSNMKRSVTVWDLENSLSKATIFHSLEDPVSALLSPSIEIMALESLSTQGAVEVWKLRELEHPYLELEFEDGWKPLLNQSSFSPDGRWLALFGGKPGSRGSIRILDILSGTQLAELADHHRPTWRADGNTLAALGIASMSLGGTMSYKQLWGKHFSVETMSNAVLVWDLSEVLSDAREDGAL